MLVSSHPIFRPQKRVAESSGYLPVWRYARLLSTFLMCICCCLSQSFAQDQKSSSQRITTHSGRIFPAGFVASQALFTATANTQQADVRHVAIFDRAQVFVRGNGVSHVLSRTVPNPEVSNPDLLRLGGGAAGNATQCRDAAPSIDELTATHHETYRVDLRLRGVDQLAPARRQYPGESVLRRNFGTEQRAYARLQFEDAYAGIDYLLDASASELKTEFRVQPHTDPGKIEIEILGAEDIFIDAAGNLIISTPLGQIREQAPLAFQFADPQSEKAYVQTPLNTTQDLKTLGVREVACRFALDGNVLRFELGDYDSSKMLVIDPLVEWKTLFGGNRDDVLRELRCDADDNLLVTGYSGSLDFPANVGQLTMQGETDAFVAEFNPSGVLQWATLIGGAAADRGVALTIDSQGAISLVGSTLSDDFPLSANSQARSFNEDAFIAQLAADGSLNWSVLLAGNGTEFALDVNTAANDDVCVVGVTNSTNLPTNVGQLARAGSFDGFAAAFDNNGDLRWASYLGGSSVDQCFAITRDGRDLILGGQTRSADFPVTGGQLTIGGDYDGFVARIADDGTPNWTSFLGGRRLDGVQDVTIAPDGNIVAVGFTASPDFGADRGKICLSAEDVFITKMRPNGTVLWKTLFGGNAGEPNGATIGLRYGPSVSTALDGTIYLAGATASTDLPARIEQTQLAGGEDLYLAQFCSDGGLEWSTYCGSIGKERGFGLALDGRGQIYFGGWTDASTFPATLGRTQVRGGSDIVLGKAEALDTCAFSLTVTPAEIIEICEGERSMVRANSAECYVLDDFRWIDLSNGNVVARGEQFEVERAGEYEVRASSPCACDVVGRLRVRVNPKPRIVDLRDTVFCRDGNAVRLEALVESQARPLRYSWSPVTGLSNPNILQPFASPQNSQTYILTVEDRNGCLATSTVDVAVDDSPLVRIAVDTLEICAGESSQVQILDAASELEFEWTPGILVDDQTARRPNARGRLDGWLYMAATNRAGCVKRDSVYIKTLETEISLERSELDFGLLGDCSEAAVLDVNLRNDGNTVVEITTLRLNSAEFSLIAPASLPQSLAPGETLEIQIRYAPNASGEHSARLIIEAGPCTTALQLRLRGRRDDLALALEPAQLDFGQLVLCEQVGNSVKLTLRNEASTDLRIDALTLPAPFSLPALDLPFSIAPGASFELTVRVDLQNEGPVQADLLIGFSNGDCEAERFVELLAAASRPRLVIEPNVYDLGLLGECELSRDSTIVLRNDGDIPLTGIRLNPVPGLAVLNSVPTNLAPGESANLDLRLSAAQNGVTVAILQFLYEPCTSSTVGSMRVERSANGLELPGLIDFGFIEYCPNTSATQALLLVNNGAAGEVTISEIMSPAPFKINANVPVSLSPGQEVQLALEFAPTAAGTFTEELELTVLGCDEPLLVTMQARSAELTLDLAELDFGGVPEGRRVTRELLLNNPSAETIIVEELQLAAGPFRILSTSQPLPASVAPGGELRVELEFSAGVDDFTERLTVMIRSQCAQLATTIRGRGIARSVTSSTIAVPALQRSVYDRATRVPVYLTDFSPATTSALSYSAELRFNATVFNPVAALDADLQIRREGQEVFVRLDGSVNGAQTGDTLAWLLGDVLLGNAAESTIAIVQFAWSDTDISTATVDGNLRLLELCERGDGTRLLNYVEQFGIHVVHPHPVHGEVEILIRTLEAAPTQFELVDVNGRRLKSEFWRPNVVGQWFHLRYDDLPRGAYMLILRSPARVSSERLLIVD